MTSQSYAKKELESREQLSYQETIIKAIKACHLTLIAFVFFPENNTVLRYLEGLANLMLFTSQSRVKYEPAC